MRQIWLWRVTNLVGFFYLIKRFVHCDLNLQNILMFDNGKIKIDNFGFAKIKEKQKKSNEVKKVELRGTHLYMSPESVNHNEYKSPVDIWAC